MDNRNRIPEHPPYPEKLLRAHRGRRMLMTPGMVAIGGLLAFFTVVFSVVVLPTSTYKPQVSPNWLPLDDTQVSGRAVYLANGCVYCHSGFSRPQDVFTGSSALYARASQPGDYAGISQSPNTLGSIRTGPDMSNEGGTHPDGWHRSHYWNARSTTPMSVMPRFSFLSADETDALISYTQSQGGKLAALRYAATQTGNYLMRLNAGKAGLDDPGVPVADLVAQLRSTGELRENGTPKDKAPSGMSWMDVWHMNSFSRSYWLTDNPLEVNAENLMRGKATYIQRCAGCHGRNGDGKGPGAERLKVKPFDFTQTNLPYDTGTSSGMMYHRILTAGPGTAMENFGTRLSVAEIWRTVMFLRTIPNGGLKETLPTVEMYERWNPPETALRYIAENPIDETYTDLPKTDDPFMQAARWIAPGMTANDTIYVGGKLPITLDRLAGVIGGLYRADIQRRYDDATARGEAIPALAELQDTEGLVFHAP